MSITAYYFWSSNCEQITSVIDDIKDDYKQVTWVSVDSQNDSEGLATLYHVTTIPTVVVVTGEFVESHSGTAIAGYYRIIRHAIRIANQSS